MFKAILKFSKTTRNKIMDEMPKLDSSSLNLARLPRTQIGT